MPSSVTFGGEEKEIHLNAFAALYLVVALFWLFMCYTEITGKWLTMPEKVVEAQRVPVEQPEGEKQDE